MNRGLDKQERGDVEPVTVIEWGIMRTDREESEPHVVSAMTSIGVWTHGTEAAARAMRDKFGDRVFSRERVVTPDVVTEWVERS